ncbi:hypothetical protein [Clostridium sp. CF012]|uniref:hypothetical protein n=1 Tax=Clostridium sp. CF012 TaxID=2843319 RepID=UPI001C0E025A|nr:hypothetical protein [Clostridium sp. CF012]MBU3144016.1 hypothetical protein [Clostridium sp. CF012]
MCKTKEDAEKISDKVHELNGHKVGKVINILHDFQDLYLTLAFFTPLENSIITHFVNTTKNNKITNKIVTYILKCYY